MNQSIGAWSLDCAFAEGKVRLGKVSSRVQCNGVPNTTYALIEVEGPSQSFNDLNEEGNGNLFPAYASVLVARQDTHALR